MKKIRLIEFFAGYGSQAFALDYLGVDYESWRTCEWAVKSIQAYKDGHCKDDSTDYSVNMTKEQLIDYLYNKGISSNYNEPMARKQVERLGEIKLRTIYNNIIATKNLVNIQQVKGSDLGIVDTDRYEYMLTYSFPCTDLSLAGKRLGMAKDGGTRSGMLWEVERILKECNELNQLPQILIMENVPQVHGKKNKQDFEDWCKFLENLGYVNNWKDLNAKNFGVPQNRNRCFMVSILNGEKFEFPNDIGLKLKLNGVLEKEVDEKYYLSDMIVSHIMIRDAIYDCFLTDSVELLGDTEDSVDNIELRQVGQIYPNSGNPQAGRIYDADGLCPCLDTMQGGNREPKVVENIRICAMRGRDPNNPKNRGKHDGLEQMIELGSSETSNCLTTVQKDNYVCECDKLQWVKQNLKIRKLTPKECFRLMGVKDSDFENIAKNQSNSSLYHLAGDSIVINVLMEIFKMLIKFSGGVEKWDK